MEQIADKHGHIHRWGCVMCGDHKICSKCVGICKRCIQSRPLKVAEYKGHTMKEDPPAAMSSVERWTCEDCGKAFIKVGNNVYGSALKVRCNNGNYSGPVQS